MNKLSPGYIYCITSPDTRKYIGSTKDLSTRKSAHKNKFKDLNNRQELYVNMRELGWDNFKWSILEQFKEITLKDLRNKESEYIHKHNTLDPKYGFNKIDPRIVNYEYFCDCCNGKYTITNHELYTIEFECEICYKILVNKEEYYVHENECKTNEIKMLHKIIMKGNEEYKDVLERCRGYRRKCNELENELYELRENIYKSQIVNKRENISEFCSNTNPRYQIDPLYHPTENLSTKFVKEKFSTNVVLEDLESIDNLSSFLWCYILCKRVMRKDNIDTINGDIRKKIIYQYNDKVISNDYTHELIDQIFNDIGELLVNKVNNIIYDSLSNIIRLIRNNENLTNRINSVIGSKQIDKKLLSDIKVHINDKTTLEIFTIYEMINDKEQYKKLIAAVKNKIYRFIIFS